MRRVTCILISLLFVSCAITPASCWEALDDDRNPAISWGGGLILFEDNCSALKLYMGKSGEVVTIEPSIGSGTGKIDLLRKSNIAYIPYAMPSIAPDSRMIAWVALEAGDDMDFNGLVEHTGFQNILIGDLKTAKAFRLTDKGGTLPVWSPDSNWVAYVSPEGQLKAKNIHNKETKLLAEKLTTVEKLTWLPSGPAVSLIRDNQAAWYSIQASGELTRITKPIPVPQRRGCVDERNAFRWWDWALSRDGDTLIYVEDSQPTPDADPRCLVLVSDRDGIRKLAEIDNKTYRGEHPGGPIRIEVSLSGLGEKFAMSVSGGIWKGDVKTGRLIGITRPRH